MSLILSHVETENRHAHVGFVPILASNIFRHHSNAPETVASTEKTLTG